MKVFILFVIVSSCVALRPHGAPLLRTAGATRAPCARCAEDPAPVAAADPAPAAAAVPGRAEPAPSVPVAEPPQVTCDYPGCVDGRVMGGLGAIPLFAWWPIKARGPAAHRGAACLPRHTHRLRELSPVSGQLTTTSHRGACMRRRTGRAPPAPPRASATAAKGRRSTRSLSRRTLRAATTATTEWALCVMCDLRSSE